MVSVDDGFARPAPLVRMLGWSILMLLFGFLVNNYLIVSRGWPSLASLMAGNFSARAWIQITFYLVGFLVVIAYVRSTADRPLRTDAQLVTRFNTYLVRGFFWGVLFVGLADMAISFLRVEGLLGVFFSEEMIKELGRAQYRGRWLHMPLIGLGMVVALFTRTIGFHWLALLIVAAELAIVFTRFVFSYEQAFMGDLVRFWYAALFLFASAYTLLEEGHVRVDVFYTGMARRTKGAVNAFGALFLGMSLCWTIIIIGFKGKASIIYGPVANFEVSQSGFGMYTKYLMAAFLGVFAITMLIQFVSQLFDACADFRNDPGGRVEKSETEQLIAETKVA